jgi:hypothetical protein
MLAHPRRVPLRPWSGIALTLVVAIQPATPTVAGGRLVTLIDWLPLAQAAQPPAKAWPKEAAAPRRSIEVKVINGQTSKPEPGVKIRVSLALNREGTTDAEGRYRVEDHEQLFKVVRFRIQKPGFVPLMVYWNNAMAEVPAEFPRDYTITINPGSAIGGIVQDEQGRPIALAGVNLSILSSTGQKGDGKPQIDLQNFRTQTNAEGR